MRLWLAKVLQGSSSFSEVLMVLEASARASAGLEGLVNFSEVLSGYLKFSQDISWVLRVSQVLYGLLMCQRTSMDTSGSLSFRVVLFLYFSISPQFTNVLSYSSILSDSQRFYGSEWLFKRFWVHQGFPRYWRCLHGPVPNICEEKRTLENLRTPGNLRDFVC